MSVSPAQENQIISRWTSGQGIRSIARDMSLGRYVIARVIAEHRARTSTPSPVIGPKPITRKSKLDPFIDQLRQLLERYPSLTALHALEELRSMGYLGDPPMTMALLDRVVDQTNLITFEGESTRHLKNKTKK